MASRKDRAMAAGSESKPRCGNCRYRVKMECRRWPPTRQITGKKGGEIIRVPAWLHVPPTSWCGEHAPG